MQAFRTVAGRRMERLLKFKTPAAIVEMRLEAHQLFRLQRHRPDTIVPTIPIVGTKIAITTKDKHYYA